MLLRMLRFLEWCSIMMMNKGSCLSVMCFGGAGIYFCVFTAFLSLSICVPVTDEPCHMEEHPVWSHQRSLPRALTYSHVTFLLGLK